MMTSIHLLALVHGMWGNPGHLSEMDRVIRETQDEPSKDGCELRVILAKANSEESTYDGIDWGGERVAEEIINEVAKLADEGKKVTRFSVTGYSLGGLISRYVVGVLHQRGFFDRITPVNFNTFATPHIGLPRYRSFWSSLGHKLGPTLLSRTGEQFYCVDNWSSTGRPLILVMADPRRIFFKALSQFQNITIYGNAANDITVPYVTACIEPEDPFALYLSNGIEVEMMDKYSPLIKSWSFSPTLAVSSQPKQSNRTWFKSTDDKPMLPPFLQFRFPLNIVLYLSLPFLIPVAISFAITRFIFQSRQSRARIRLLEKEDSPDKLAKILAKLEREMEATVADLVNDSGASPVDSDIEVAVIKPATSNPDTPESSTGEVIKCSKKTQGSQKEKRPVEQPILQPIHYQMIEWMNSIPHLKKERAFITKTRNSHAMIVCRDVKRFSINKGGEGVLRHWADHFML